LFFIFPTAVLAIIFGHISRSQIAKSANRIGGAGMAPAGMILGYIGVAFIPFILIVAAIVIPNLLRARIAANESSAVGSLRSIATAAITYSSSHGSFPPSLESMGPEPGGANLIDRTLATGRRTGYTFEYQSITSEAGRPSDGFIATADPIQENQTGQRHFFLDETGVVRVQRNGPAGKESPPLD
jgi:type II secretory pathway pseudopilin PulG